MFISALACVRLLLDQSRAALALCAESVAASPDWDVTCWVTAAAAGDAGDARRASEVLRNLQRIVPGPTLAFPEFRIYCEARRRDRLLEGLRKAGLFDASDSQPGLSAVAAASRVRRLVR